MLLELYYIVNGVDIFHYSKENLDQNHFVLSSGFLTALTNFSSEVRSGKIDFFASETEIFMFEELERDKSLVLIFENTINQQVARQVMRNVINLLDDFKIRELAPHVGLLYKDEKRLQSQIEAMSNSLISTEYQVVAAEEVIKAIHLDYMIIYDYAKDKIFLQHGDYSKLDEDEIFLALRKLSKVLTPVIKSFGIGANVAFFSIESYEYHFVLIKNRTNFTMVLVKDPEDLSYVNNIPFQVLSLPGWDHFSQNYSKAKMYSSWKIDNDKNITIQEGESESAINKTLIHQAMDTISRLCAAFNLVQFNNYVIYSDKNAYVRVDQYFTRGYHLLAVHK